MGFRHDVEQHSGVTRFAGSFYRWLNRTRAQPTPGAEAFAFSSEMLPLYDWKGPGEIVREQFLMTSPQVFVLQSVIPTGIAGIQAGQVTLAELLNNPPVLNADGSLS